MNVFIARGSVDVGRFPRKQLPELAREGVIKRTDIYWHKGMDGWEPISDLLGPSVWERSNETPVLDPLPEEEGEASPAGSAADPAQPSSETPPPRQTDWRKIAAIVLGALLGFVALAYLLIAPDSEPTEPAGTNTVLGGPRSLASGAATAVREKATADLQQRIARLPQQPSAPLNTYYYDLTTELEETFSARTPFRAVIKGRENVLKPESDETLSKTAFTVTAEYADGEWTYKTYVGTTVNVQDQTTTTVRHDESRLAPPVLIGILGLKAPDHTRSRQ
jgi:hypothetical protein